MKTKVYIQYPWKVSDSQYYKSMIDNPPKDIEYIFEDIKIGMITSKAKLSFRNFFKRTIRTTLEKIQVPILNIKKTKNTKDFDVIHNAHCLSSNDNPWVADFESLWQMWVSGRDTKTGMDRVSKVLKKDSCKKIIAWTESTKEEIKKTFPEVKEKITVVHYGMVSQKFKKVKSEKVRLLFIARYFEGKGGLHTLEVFDRITKKYENVEATVISEVPKNIKEKYSSNKNIKFSGLLPHKEIIENIYPNTDIMVYPGYSDTFGFALVEALAFGIPIITVDGKSRKDIISNGKTGFVIERDCEKEWYPKDKEEERIVDEIEARTTELIDDRWTREEMSEEGIKIVREGKFSIENRNKKLKEIYNEARNI